MNDITREEVERIMALAEKATPGPWFVDDNSESDFIDVEGGLYCICRLGRHEGTTEDAAHIAACDPQTILALCAAALRGIEGDPAAFDVEFADGHSELFYAGEFDEVSEEETHGEVGHKEPLYARSQP